MNKLNIRQIESKDKFLKDLSQQNISPLSEYISNTDLMKFKGIKCNHCFEMTPSSLKKRINKNKSCPKCFSKNSKLSFKEVCDRVSKSTQKEYKVISKIEDYESTRSKIKIFHKTCGEITEITYKNFSLGKRCRYCSNKTNTSKASQLLMRLLKQVSIDFEYEKTFDDCINPMTGCKLPFDFYIDKLKTVIEIDGEQHFLPVEHWGGQKKLNETQYRDYIKDKYCLENNLRLIRIPLVNIENLIKYNYDEMKKIIFNCLYEISLDYFSEA